MIRGFRIWLDGAMSKCYPGGAMDEDERALEGIERQLRDGWPDLYMRADASIATLVIYGAEKKFAEQLEMARELADPYGIDVVSQSWAVCSKSSTDWPARREIGEPTPEGPRPVKEDGRGVWLGCDSREKHNHDWGDYEPLDPHRF